MSITWWSASVVVRFGRRVRQTLFHTVGGTGTVRSDKGRGVLRVGSCSEKIMSRTPVPERFSVDVQPSSRFLCSSFVRSCNYRFSSVSCTKLFWSLKLPTVDATTFARCLTCQEMRRSGWSKHCLELVTLYRDRGICSSKDACFFLLKRP